ncbi:hypothetical protein BASA83_010703 [Batrachochytrium salamandrivorans]|nr:hypothetical protein BASA83_010703 [Batrachochytrium salamandrivorans]
MDYPRALKAGLLHPTATARPAGQSQPVYTLSCSLGLQAHGPLGDTLSSRQSALLTRKFPDRPRTQWKKTPLPGPPPQTPHAAISSTPTPTQISYVGSDDILTVLLGGSLPGTNTAGNTEASWSAMADRYCGGGKFA